MKTKISLFALLLGMILISNVLNAQDSTVTQAKPVTNENRKNVVKLNLVPFGLMAVGLSNFSMQYERALGNKISVCLGFSYMPSSGLPSQYASSDLLKALKISGYSITPEFRFYLGKKGAPRGFYLAPYFKYASYSITTNYKFTRVDTVPGPPPTTVETPFDWAIKGNYSFIGGGLMMGVHYIIKNRVSIDWGILGAHFGASKVSMSVSDPANFGQFPDQVANDLEKELSDSYSSLPGKAVVDVTKEGFTVDYKPPFSGGVRSLVGGWFTIGIAF